MPTPGKIIKKMMSNPAEIELKVAISLCVDENSYSFNVSKMADVGYF
jgi:hypothetical protein